MTPSGSSSVSTALYLAGTQLWAGTAGAAGTQLVSLYLYQMYCPRPVPGYHFALRSYAAWQNCADVWPFDKNRSKPLESTLLEQ
jgi:hypothetical protein